MKYDTAGKRIYEPIQNCDCGLTGGCEKCNPLAFRVSQIDGFIGILSDEEAKQMKKKLIIQNEKMTLTNNIFKKKTTSKTPVK